MTETTQRRAWAASGLGFLVCSGIGLLLENVFASAFYPPPFSAPFAPATNAITYFTTNRLQVQATSFVFAIAALSLVVFVAYCAGMLADQAPGRQSALPGLALGAGTLAAGFWLLTALLLWVLSRPVTIASPDLLQVMLALAYLCGGPAHIMTLGIFLGAVSVALWSQSMLPRWITWIAAAAAIPSVLAVLVLVWEPASLLLPLGRGLALLWIFATSVALLIPLPGEAPADADRPAEPSARQPLQREPHPAT
jgi:hypothetical protein